MADNVIEVRDLVKRYRHAAHNAVDGLSFDVPDGQLFCLLGRTSGQDHNALDPHHDPGVDLGLGPHRGHRPGRGPGQRPTESGRDLPGSFA